MAIPGGIGLQISHRKAIQFGIKGGPEFEVAEETEGPARAVGESA